MLKQNIRKGVFETNSSSTHSICINECTKYTSISPNTEGYIVCRGDEFGWGWEKFNDPMKKLNYCMQYPFGDKNMLKKVVLEQTKAKDLVDAIDYSSNNYTTYIDHQSIEDGDVLENAYKDEVSLRNFIFSENSYLYIGNDNGDHPPNFFDEDLSKFTHELCIEGCDKTEKCNENLNEEQIDNIINRLWGLHDLNKNGPRSGIYYNKPEYVRVYDPKNGCHKVNFDNKTFSIVKENRSYEKVEGTERNLRFRIHDIATINFSL